MKAFLCGLLGGAVAFALLSAALAVAQGAGWGVPSVIGKSITFDSGTYIFDTTNTEAVLVRANNDAADVLRVNTTNLRVEVPNDVETVYGTAAATTAGQIGFETGSTPDALFVGVDETSRILWVTDYGDIGAAPIGAGLSNASDPTLVVGSASSPYIAAMLYYDGVNAGPTLTASPAGAGTGGATIYITATAAGSGNAAGGGVAIQSGAGSGTVGGGNIALTTAAGGATDAAAGDLNVTLGAGGGSGDDGDVNITCNDSSQVMIDADTNDTTLTTGTLHLNVGSATANASGAYCTFNQAANVSGQTCFYATHDTVTAMTGANVRSSYVAVPRGHASDGAGTATVAFHAKAPTAGGGAEIANFVETGYQLAMYAQSGDVFFADYAPTIQTDNANGGASDAMTFKIADAVTSGAAGNFFFEFGTGAGGGAPTSVDFRMETGSTINFRNGSAHLNHENDGNMPSLSSCGTTPSITGGDVAGKITIGSGTITSCTVTFVEPYGGAPACNVTSNNSSDLMASTSTTALTITSGADMSGDVVMYFCVGVTN